MILNDLKPPKARYLLNFSQCLAARHISTVNCDEIAGYRPRQPAYEIFSIKRFSEFLALNAEFSTFDFDPLDSRKSAQAGVKDGYSLKSGYFTAIDSSSVKTVADNEHW